MSNDLRRAADRCIHRRRVLDRQSVEGVRMLFRRFKGMIYPGMGASYADAKRICKTRSRWMVEYLRARRDPALRYKAMARRNHLETRNDAP